MKSYAFFIATLIVFTCVSSAGSAQNLDSYTPPPLFGGGENVQDTLPDNVAPPPVKQEPKMAPKKYVAPQKEESDKKIPPAKKVNSQLIETQEEKVAKPKSMPKVIPEKKPDIFAAPEPEKPVVKKEPEKIEPEKSQQGVVKGPKTMPAVKKQGVDAEVIFEDNDNSEAFVLKTPDQSARDEIIELDVVNEVMTPPNPDQTKWIMEFKGDKEELSETQKNIVLNEVLPHLLSKPNSRLMIAASPSYDNKGVLNKGRRIALTRALNIRGILMTKNIESNRMDVRTLEADLSQLPMNQAQIELLEP